MGGRWDRLKGEDLLRRPSWERDVVELTWEEIIDQLAYSVAPLRAGEVVLAWGGDWPPSWSQDNRHFPDADV
jgi:hypothetical protein